MEKNLRELLVKRANGFYYNEEVAEYDVVGGDKFVLCKKHSRLYLGNGYLRIKIAKIYVGNRIVRLNKIKPKLVVNSAKTIKKLSIFAKIKGKYLILRQ